MATKKVEKTEEATKEVVKKSMKYRLEFEDGTVIEGSTKERGFKPNAKGFTNTGFQTRIEDGQFSGSVMIIDGDQKVFS